MRWKNFLLRPASSLCIGVLGCKKSLVRRDVQRGLGSESHHRFQRETGHMLNPFSAIPEAEKFDRFLSGSEGISQLISNRDLGFSHDSTPALVSTFSSGVSAVP